MPLQHQQNWYQPPLPIAHHPSRANGGAPVPAPAIIGPSIPPPSHQHPIRSIRPIQPVSNQPEHKIHFLLANSRPKPIQSIRYNPDDPSNTIQPTGPSRYDLARVSSEGNPPTRPSLIRDTHPQLPQLLIFHPPQRPLMPKICSLPLMLHVLLPSLLHI